jgi:tRNA dimethylallyltransferase
MLLDELFKKSNTVILVGGSGLYLQALTQGLDKFPEVNPKDKAFVEKLWADSGIEALQNLLRELDPQYAQVVDLQNPMRLIRALSVCLSSKQPYSNFLGKPKPTKSFQHIAIGIEGPRPWLYQRINQRVDQMVQEGLFDEASSLYPHKELNALKTVGYTEVFAFMDGVISREQAIEDIKTNTRRYAKRQGTWFRRQSDIHWISAENPTKQAKSILQKLGVSPV